MENNQSKAKSESASSFTQEIFGDAKENNNPDRIWSMNDINTLLDMTAGDHLEKKSGETDEDILRNLNLLESRYTDTVDETAPAEKSTQKVKAEPEKPKGSEKNTGKNKKVKTVQISLEDFTNGSILAEEEREEEKKAQEEPIQENLLEEAEQGEKAEEEENSPQIESGDDAIEKIGEVFEAAVTKKKDEPAPSVYDAIEEAKKLLEPKAPTRLEEDETVIESEILNDDDEDNLIGNALPGLFDDADFNDREKDEAAVSELSEDGSQDIENVKITFQECIRENDALEIERAVLESGQKAEEEEKISQRSAEQSGEGSLADEEEKDTEPREEAPKEETGENKGAVDEPTIVIPKERPSIFLKRGVSDTEGFEPLPQILASDVLLDTEVTQIVKTYSNPEIRDDGECDEQLTFEGFENYIEKSEPVDEEKLLEDLKKSREDKKNSFVLLKTEEESDEPKIIEDLDDDSDEGEREEYESEESDEYEDESCKDSMLDKLKRTLTHMKGTSIALCVLLIISIFVGTIPSVINFLSIDLAILDKGSVLLSAINIVLLIITLFFTSRSFMGGFICLKSRRVTSHTVSALTILLALLQGAVLFLNKEPSGAASYLYSSAAIFAMLLSNEGERTNLKRVLGNFIFCAETHKDELYAIRCVEDEDDAFKIGSTMNLKDPKILYSGRILFPSNFMESSLSGERINKMIARNLILSAVLSVAASIVSIFVTKNIYDAVSVLTAAFCLTAPVSALLSLALPLRSENILLNRYGGMITNYDSADECANADAVSIDSGDLFDRARCKIDGIKDFNTVRIDAVMLYTVAMVLRSGGPLCEVFDNVVAGKHDILPRVDDLKYEDRLGLSCVIDNQTVLLGNRTLLHNHNIEAPFKSLEDKYSRMGKQILYIAIDSKPAAMYVISYAQDKSLTRSLEIIEDNGIGFIIRTDDPNVTSELLANKFNLVPDRIKTTLWSGSETFRLYHNRIIPKLKSGVIHDGTARSYLRSIASSQKLSKFGTAYNISMVIISIAAAAGAIASVIMKSSAFLSPLSAIALHAVCIFLAFFIQKFRE